jgi:hypothetical protein
MGGWRGSADRARLHRNSLLTGNFTGNFAILRLREPISQPETTALQRLVAQFPEQINRENFSKIREDVGWISELCGKIDHVRIASRRASLRATLYRVQDMMSALKSARSRSGFSKA